MPCSEPHTWRAVTTIKLGDEGDPYPGDRLVEVTTRDFCSESVGRWLGYPADYDFGYTWFHEAEWQAGNRRSVCWAKTTVSACWPPWPSSRGRRLHGVHGGDASPPRRPSTSAARRDPVADAGAAAPPPRPRAGPCYRLTYDEALAPTSTRTPSPAPTRTPR